MTPIPAHAPAAVTADASIVINTRNSKSMEEGE